MNCSPRDSLALAPSVNSDFFNLTIPIISSDIDSDIGIDCGQDQFASDPCCVAAPTLIRRNNDNVEAKAQWDMFNKLGTKPNDASLSERMAILVIEADKVSLAASYWPETPAMAYKAFTDSNYYNFFRSSDFQNLMSRISIRALTEVFFPFGMMRPDTPHDFRLTKVVYNYLTRQGGIDNTCLPTRQAFLIAKEIVNLNNDGSSPDALSLEMQHEKQLIAKEYLPKFHDLLKGRVYTNDPEIYIPSNWQHTMIKDLIRDISSSYMAWKGSKNKKKSFLWGMRNKWNLGALENQFKKKLKICANGTVRIVLEAYIWLLSQPDQSESKAP